MGYVRMHLEEHVSIQEIEKRYGISHSQVSAWARRYLEGGEEALEPKDGNPYAALHTSKRLGEIERLQLFPGREQQTLLPLSRCPQNFMEKREGQGYKVFFHTNQGLAYPLRAYSNAHKHYNIPRSMSRGARLQII